MTKLSIELVNSDRIDVVLKGDKHTVIQTIVLAMDQYPELRLVILESAKEFLSKNKFNLHLQ